MGEAGGGWLVEGAEWLRKHWEGLRWRGKGAVVLVVALAGAFVVKTAFFSGSSAENITVNGPAQVGAAA